MVLHLRVLCQETVNLLLVSKVEPQIFQIVHRRLHEQREDLLIQLEVLDQAPKGCLLTASLTWYDLRHAHRLFRHSNAALVHP